ncbi:spermatogenesis-associated protein 20 isoform X1 [Podarcis lilfordi]|uniref:Spermatogenesis-associated protein 20 isoform X1 n=3 Tax=Podarcis lilfordi TaxID=74358 RepID=A0AA35NY86_9SAUR|nr:spermatogenesis-associated protein 20 isoform X1 [Podarcis lilfordi]
MISAPVALLRRAGGRLLLRRAGLSRTSWARRSIQLRAALAMATGGKGSQSSTARPTNRLIYEKSPYLLQHAHNPVDWYPWGQEAFDKAKREDKLIFLSVGYSTCHWCHVMEQESFQNEEIGQILNDNFVCIKVDREERPDVDKVYMAFVQATSSGGGWPMSVWLTPDLKPFVGGTYFPPEDGIYQVGFRTVLLRILEQWKRNKTSLMENSQKILSALLARTDVGARGEEAPPSSKEVTSRCFQQLSESYDEEYGGFSESPKFPTPVNLNFLFSYWALHRSTTEGARALQMALHTLKMMAYGGVHDHIAQGFHRYSTDQRWHVPHFEKMLYDQGQLAAAYAKAFQISGDEFFADIVADILLYVSRDLSDGSGGFYSAEDADSYPTVQSTEKQEGAFCVWTAEEIRWNLPDPIEGIPEEKTMADVFMHHYGVKEDGNVNPMKDPHNELKGKNVLIVQYSLELTAARFGLQLEQLKTLLAKGKEKLSKARGLRPRPHLDTKMLASWNGLMISGFAQSGAILGKREYTDRAVRAASFLRHHMFSTATGKLIRSCYRGQGSVVEKSSIHGFLEDYVFVIQALFDLYEASLDPNWLEWAVQLQHKQDELFWDPKGFAYFSTEAGDPSLLLRMKDDQDGAEPCPNSIAVTNLLRAASYTGHKEWVKKAGQILAAFSERLLKIPVVLPEMARSAAAFHQTLKQVVICGDPAGEDTRELLHCYYSTYTPNRVLILADGDTKGFLYSHLGFLSSLEKKDGKATAYLCENFACSLPVTSSQELRRLLLP